MPIEEKVKKEIDEAKVNGAELFMYWILVSIPNVCISPEAEEEAIKYFISKKLTPEIAWDILRQNESLNYAENFKKNTNADYKAELMLITLATKGRKFPDEYSEVIRSLIFLYQNTVSQPVVLTVINNLLLIPEFRNAFKNDLTLSPFFTQGFNDALKTHIEKNCEDPNLKNELLEVCRPKLLDSKNIDAELIKAFGYKEPLGPEQQDIIAIQKFLGDTSPGSAVMKQLQLLEVELENEAKAKQRYDDKTKGLKGYEEGKVYDHNKLLSGFLQRWAEENNFLGYGKLKGFMTGPEFFSFLAKGGIFKDPVLRGDFHGEFTHAIQWYLITMWNNEDPKKPKLNCHPSRILQWIGENNGKFKEWSGTFEASVRSLYKPTSIDFRKVDNLHQYLNSKDCDLTVLHQLNLGRTLKGKREFLMDVEPEFEKFKGKNTQK